MVMMVRKVQKDKEEPFMPEIDMFPWHSWCCSCPWRTNTGAWRDAFDLAFYHAQGGVHIEPEDTSIIVPAVAIPTVRNGVAVPGDGNPAGTVDPGGSDPSPSVPPGGPVRENPLEQHHDWEDEPMDDITGRWAY